MDKIRAFIAIDINEETRRAIDDFMKKLRALSLDAKWVKPENIHITMKFLGNISIHDHDKLYKGINMIIKETAVFRLSFEGAGCFPGPNNPRVLWVGVKGELEPLRNLQGAIEDRLNEAGFPREDRGFAPHVTFGRLRSNKNAEGLKEILKNYADARFGEDMVSSLNVYKSTLTPAGPNYNVLKEFKFGKIG